MRKQKLLLSASAAAVLLATAPVHALEVKVSGQINAAVITGDATEDTTIVDNTMSGSRFRFKGEQDIGGGLKAGMRYELQFQPNNSAAAGASGGVQTSDIRWSQAYVKGGFGMLAIGKSEGAASDVADATFGNGNFHSTTQLIWLAYRGAYRDKIGDETAGLFIPFDAAGRSNNIQYHSPKLGGFKLALGLDNGDQKEIAVRYQGKIAGGKLKARVGQRDTPTDKITAGSFLYQTGFGLNFGAGFGTMDSDETRDWTSIAIGYKAGKFGASFETAEDDRDAGSTSFGVSYYPAKGMTWYANHATFDGVGGGEVTSGSMLGFKINF